MIKIIAILVVYIIYWIIEIFHDDILRKKENTLRGLMRLYARSNPDYIPDYEEETKQLSKWHSLDWKGHALLALLMGFLATKTIWMIPIYAITIGSLRVLILNIGGNIKASRKLFYVGDYGIESKFIGKEILYYSLWLVILFLSLYLIC